MHLRRAVSFNSCSEFEEQSWTAASLLCDIHAIRQREKETVMILSKR